MKNIILVGILVIFSGCTNHDKTVETLSKSGYSEIVTGGYNIFSCGEDDTYSTNFTAKNPVGNVVSGTVCCGILFKGCTVRF